MIEILLVLVFVLILHILATGFELKISSVELVVWCVGGIVLTIFGARFLMNRLTEGLASGGRWRKRGPAADGLDLLRKGDLGGAEALLRRCLERNPADAEALRGLSDIAFRHGDFEHYLQLTARILSQPDALRRSERVALCHRQADVCLERLNDPKRAVEALARMEVDYPGTTDALRARQRIERILSVLTNEMP